MGTSPSREARRQRSSGLAASNVLCIPHRAAPLHGYRSIQAPVAYISHFKLFLIDIKNYVRHQLKNNLMKIEQ